MGAHPNPNPKPHPHPNPNPNPNRIGRPPLALALIPTPSPTPYLPLRPPLPLPSACRRGSTKYRDYYFLPQYEAGQPELVTLHHYTYEVYLPCISPVSALYLP